VRLSLLNCNNTIFSRNSLIRFVILGTACMASSHLNVTLLFLLGCGILQFTPSPGPNETVLLLHKLLFKVLPVTTFHVRNSVISFYILCLVHFGVVVVMQFSLICLTVFVVARVVARVLVLVVVLFCILYVTNLALWLQDFNKLTYLRNITSCSADS